MSYIIDPATVQDGITLFYGLIPADREELEAITMDPLSGLLQGIKDSLRPVSIFDRERRLAAIAGVVPMDGHTEVGAPWMLSTAFARTEPHAFVKQAREWVEEELLQYDLLRHEVYRHNRSHIRLIRMLGFTVDKPSHGSQLFLPFYQTRA